MRRTLFLLIFTLSITHLFSQQIFRNSIFPPNEVPLSMHEDSNGNINIVGYVSDSLFQNLKGYIVTLNSTGDLVEQFLYGEDEEKVSFSKILSLNNKRIVFGAFTDFSQRKLFFIEFDSEWNEIVKKTINIPPDRNLADFRLIIDSDSNLVFTGSTLDYINNYPNNFNLKYDLLGDSIVSFFNNSNYHPISYCIQESFDNTKYYNIIANFHSNGYSGILQLNKTFDTIGYYIFSRDLFYTYSSLPYKDSLILLVGINTINNHKLELCVSNEYGNINQTLSFEKEPIMKEHPALIHPLSKINNHIYLGSTSNFDDLNVYYSQFDSWFHLIKLDTSLTVIWEKWYGGDAYYFLNSVLATSDGGCLLVGTKYPHGSPSLIRYSHFVKVDANGDVMWTQDIKMPELSYKVYPNPTQSVFNIENSELNIIQIELYDISGRYLTSKSDCSNSTISIDLSPFSNGIYFAKIKSSKGVRTEKVVKN